jgi:hypothetical protein
LPLQQLNHVPLRKESRGTAAGGGTGDQNNDGLTVHLATLD